MLSTTARAPAHTQCKDQHEEIKIEDKTTQNMLTVNAGLVITVSALVAAGIAVYESPQFRQWVDNSRRKIAVALHNLGDEIQPRNATSPARQDISMTEEVLSLIHI